MESYPLPAYGTNVTLALFANLGNAQQIKERLVAASTLPSDEAGNAERAAVEFAFIDAKSITSRLHLLTAISQALLAQSDRTLRTKTVQSEVLWLLEPGTAINDSLRHFGLSATTSHLVLVHFSSLQMKGSEVYDRMTAVVAGDLVSLDLLGTEKVGLNVKGLRKMYKLNQDAALKDVEVGSEEERRVVDGLCTGAVALKVVT
ncbi:hypothetical protein P7C70_g348, partial [Phenoliferia sp. Uapishka_3]